MDSLKRLPVQTKSNESFARDELIFKPLTSSEWPDFNRLFEEHGIQNGCWCMYWRVARIACHQGFGDENKRAFKAIVDSGRVPGILAYLGGQPVAWCSIAPRADFPVLERSRTLKPIDNLPVWSITCFFVSKPFRRQGMTEILIQGAIQYASEQRARIIEAYPLRTEITKLLLYERYMGIQSTFERAGFVEVASRSERRPILRFYVNK
jgi:GNAT superfamily N-acetyltransferase